MLGFDGIKALISLKTLNNVLRKWNSFENVIKCLCYLYYLYVLSYMRSLLNLLSINDANEM